MSNDPEIIQSVCAIATPGKVIIRICVYTYYLFFLWVIQPYSMTPMLCFFSQPENEATSSKVVNVTPLVSLFKNENI
jgi:hypothetical protein